MNSRKPKAGSRGPVGSGPLNQQPYTRYAKQNARGNSDKTSSSPVISHEGDKAAPAAADQVAASVEGVYLNGRIMHTITSLIGSIVQVVVSDGQTYEGVLKTFSPEFEIAVATATEIDPRSGSEGSNICHLLSSLSSSQEMISLRLFPMKDVVTINVLNTDMDYASHGAFQTDAELASKNRIEASEERALVPWSADESPDDGRPDGNRKPARVDLESESSNGWTAEEMFAANTELGVQTGFQELDGMYTIPLNKKDTPEGREKQKQAEAIAREIENNQQSKRRAEQENSDDRTEEEQFSAVTRNAEAFRHPKAHPNIPGNRSDEMNWRQQSNRSSQQNAHPKSAAFSCAGKGSFTLPGQQQPQAGGGPGGRDQRQAGPGGPKGRHQMPPPQQQQQQQQPPHHHSQQQQNINQVPHPGAQHQHRQQQQSANVPVPPVPSPKEDVPSKSVASSAPHTPPNYAKVVAEDGSGSKNSKGSKKKDDPVPVPEQPRKQSPAAVSSPVMEKKDPAVKEKTSLDQKDDRKDETKKDDASAAKSPAESENIENIAKNSKLNPNAKEFTLNPAAKPFTPRSLQQQQQQQHHHQQQQPVQLHQQHQNNPPQTQYSNQPQNLVTQVHHIPHPHYQQQNQPQMMQIQGPGVPRMQNQQVLLHQMVGPGFPYPLVMPQYQQQVQMNQPRPGKQSSKYQNSGNRNDQYNQNSPHNVAAATGHPVLATAPITYQQQPGLGTQIFQPMYQMPGFNPRMQVGMMGPQVQYDQTHMYLGALPVSMVAPQMNQQNNGPHSHSNPSTPQSQTPTTPGLHGGPPTPGPAGHPHQGQTPTPQQTVMYTGQNLPPHSIAAGFNSQNMVLMGPGGHPQQHPQSVPHQGSHPGVGGQGGPHGMQPVIPVLQSSATPLVMQQHYQQNQPPPGR